MKMTQQVFHDLGFDRANDKVNEWFAMPLPHGKEVCVYSKSPEDGEQDARLPNEDGPFHIDIRTREGYGVRTSIKLDGPDASRLMPSILAAIRLNA